MEIFDERRVLLKKYTNRVKTARVLIFCLVALLLAMGIYTSQNNPRSLPELSDTMAILTGAMLLLIPALLTIPLPRAFMVVLTIICLYASFGFFMEVQMERRLNFSVATYTPIIIVDGSFIGLTAYMLFATIAAFKAGKLKKAMLAENT